MITQESEGLTDTLVVPTPLTMSSIGFPNPSPIYLGKKKTLKYCDQETCSNIN